MIIMEDKVRAEIVRKIIDFFKFIITPEILVDYLILGKKAYFLMQSRNDSACRNFCSKLSQGSKWYLSENGGPAENSI
jgi:hypothetical protein